MGANHVNNLNVSPLIDNQIGKYSCDSIALAKKIGVKPITVRRMAQRGEIPFLKVCGRYRFNLDEVLEKLRGN